VRQDVVKRRPAADVVPADVARHDGDIRRALENSDVDGHAPYAVPEVGVRPAGNVLHVRQAAQRGESLGQVRVKVVQDAPDRPGKVPGVPVVPSAGGIIARDGQRRFFAKALHGIDVPAGVGAQRGAALDIAETRVRTCGDDAERGDASLAGQRDGRQQAAPEALFIGNDVVGMQRDHHGIVTRSHAAQTQGRQAQAGSGAPRRRLHEDVLRRQSRQLLRDARGALRPGEDLNALRRHQRQHAGDRSLQQRLIPRQRQQLLGQASARPGPQARAAATGQDGDVHVARGLGVRRPGGDARGVQLRRRISSRGHRTCSPRDGRALSVP